MIYELAAQFIRREDLTIVYLWFSYVRLLSLKANGRVPENSYSKLLTLLRIYAPKCENDVGDYREGMLGLIADWPSKLFVHLMASSNLFGAAGENRTACMEPARQNTYFKTISLISRESVRKPKVFFM